MALDDMYLIRCKNEALKKWHFKSIIKCFKEVKRDYFNVK